MISSTEELKKLLEKKRKTSKYRASSCRCLEGHAHDSRAEARYCEQLFILKKAGEIREVKRAPQFDLYVNGKKIVGHQPDWLVTFPDGHKEVYEFKGFATEKWKIQRRLFEALHPEIPYITVSEKNLWR